MELQTEAGSPVANPKSSDVTEAIRSLDLEGNGFAILAKTKNDYVQTLLKSPGEYRVEYHDEPSDEHFVGESPLSREKAIELFEDFRTGGTRWKSMATWRNEQLRGRTGCARGGAVMIAFALAFGAIATAII